MNVLMLAFYGEGNSDREFLPPLIQRTSKAILDDYANRMVELWDLKTIDKKSGSQDKAILEAAQEAGERHALLIHNDADTRGYWKTREELFEPGNTLVQKFSGWACQNLIPVIPVREVEAWMLADLETLGRILGAKLDPYMFNLSSGIAAIEALGDPKRKLNDIVRYVNANRSRRRQQIDLQDRLEPLARQVNLHKLFELSAYREFVGDLARTLEMLHFIPYNSTARLLEKNQFSRYC